MSPSGRQLVHADGTPALMVADTAWALPWRATPEQVEEYARDRQAKGFNAVLLMTMQPDMRAVGPRDRTLDEGFDVGFEDLPDGRLARAGPRLLRPRRRAPRHPAGARPRARAGAGVPGVRLEGSRRRRQGRPAGGLRALLPLPRRPVRRPAGGLPRRRRRHGRGAAGRRRRRGGPRVGRLRPADRHPLPPARHQPRPPGRRLARLPELPDGPRRASTSRTGWRTCGATPRPRAC